MLRRCLEGLANMREYCRLLITLHCDLINIHQLQTQSSLLSIQLFLFPLPARAWPILNYSHSVVVIPQGRR